MSKQPRPITLTDIQVGITISYEGMWPFIVYTIIKSYNSIRMFSKDNKQVLTVNYDPNRKVFSHYGVYIHSPDIVNIPKEAV